MESAGNSSGDAGSHCSVGFPDRNRLLAEVNLQPGPGIRLIPEMNFTCNCTITGYTFAGRLDDGQENPMIQIWRENSSQPRAYYRTGANIALDGTLCVNGFTEVCITVI